MIRERLAKTDPSNAGWQSDLAISHKNIGGVQQAQGNLAPALDSYKAAQAIRERLVKTDPRNAGWKSDLAVSHDESETCFRLRQPRGRARQLQGRAGHQRAARHSRSRKCRLAERPSASHTNIGDLLRAQGNLAAALDSYKAALAIRERLVIADPGNAAWQSDLPSPV